MRRWSEYSKLQRILIPIVSLSIAVSLAYSLRRARESHTPPRGHKLKQAIYNLEYKILGDKIDQYNPIRLTDDEEVEHHASFLGNKVCYTSITTRRGSYPKIIYITSISDKKDKEIRAIKPFRKRKFEYAFTGLCPMGRNNILALNGKIALASLFHDENQESSKWGIFIVNSDGSPINGEDYKMIFEAIDPLDFLFLEGYLNCKLYFSRFYKKDQIYEASIDGKITEIDKLPRAIKDRLDTLHRLQTELYTELPGLKRVYDFKPDGKSNITDVLIGYVARDRKWDLYVIPYKGNLKFPPNKPEKSSSLDNKTNELFAQRLQDSKLKNQLNSYQQRMNQQKPKYHRRMVR